MIKGVVVDIDDTLYLEREYVLSGFAHVARELGRTAEEATRLESWLGEAFHAGVRGQTFDRFLMAFPEIAERTTVASLIDSYRAHPPAISLSPEVIHVLGTMKRQGLRLGVLSDGPLASQSAKATALGLERWFDPVVLTESLGEVYVKPATLGFEMIGTSWGLSPQELAYVADNPEKDFTGPRRLGWRTIRLRHSGQLRTSLEPAIEADRPDFEVNDFGAVIGALT